MGAASSSEIKRRPFFNCLIQLLRRLLSQVLKGVIGGRVHKCGQAKLDWPRHDPVWMHEEMKGTKLSKDDFLIK